MQTGEKIVEAARGILVSEGAQAVTMRRVAEAVGVTAMAIYKHHRNREALLGAVADRTFRDLAEGWGTRVPEGGWEARVDGLMHDFLDFALGSPHLYAFLMTDRREQARRFPDDFKGGGSPAFDRLVELVEEGMRAGVLREDDPLEVSLAMTSSTQGLVHLYLGGRIGLPETEFRALCARMVGRILDGVRA
ncbi:TetR/AcrR family transcriptional regulator [Sphaerisporangium corydalis]|uniref:TetR/AcrR family transcriptional regulator n=1 Tax=Sphaerisporangium corydalis TaxID=1441875 RepID=A0ABV9EG52_9ACTN|nr:TetR/AcrR family transcriptional regulator [Sphaerisporangium corydalis]